MTNLGVVVEQLKRERAQLDEAITVLSKVMRGSPEPIAIADGSHPKRRMSVGARKRIAAAQRARWAKVRAGKRAA